MLPLTHLLLIQSYSCFEQEKKKACTNIYPVTIVVAVTVLIHQYEYQTMGNDSRAKKKRSDLSDADRLVLITDRIEEFSDKQCFYTHKKPKKCSCLSTLQGDSDAMDAVASYILFWAKLNPLQQKIMLIEKIKAIHLAERLVGRHILRSTIEVTKPFQLPFFATENAETNSKLSSIFICKHSLAALHSYGVDAFNSLEKNAKENTMPTHGNVGKLSKQTLDHQNNVVPLLKDFFVNVILPLAGPRPTRWTRDAVTKTIQVRDTNDIEELDPGWSKRRLYGNFAWKLGWKIRATSKGTTVKEKRTDANWLVTEEPKQVCCRQSFNNYWSHNHPKLIVRKPSKDICSVCYKFSLLYRRKVDKRRRQAADNGDNIDSDSDNGEDDSDDDDPDDDELEQAMITVGNHIEEARSMRELLDFLHAQAQKCTEDAVDDEEMCIVLIIDFCQNLEMPSFNGTQPGETYYYSPMTVPTLGIVDGNTKENILYAYIYSEAEGNKGGNVVASLIMKYLRDRGLLDGKKRMKLTIVMDNCPGQNKNNHVVRLAPYLVAKGFFKKVGFLFLLAGHTKNWADKRFNNLKEDYRVTDLFCMDDLVKACNKSDYVVAKQVYWKDFRNYNVYLDSFFKKMDAVKIYQMFTSSVDYAVTASDDIGIGNMQYRTSNLPKADIRTQDMKKQIRGGAAARTALMNTAAGYLYPYQPGLKPIKRVELFCKYRALLPKRCQDITCPDPGQDVIDSVKKTRAEKNADKRAAKKLKEGNQKAKKPAKKGKKKAVQEKSTDGSGNVNEDISNSDSEGPLSITTKRKADQLNSDDDDDDVNISCPLNYDLQPQYFGGEW